MEVNLVSASSIGECGHIDGEQEAHCFVPDDACLDPSSFQSLAVLRQEHPIAEVRNSPGIDTKSG